MAHPSHRFRPEIERAAKNHSLDPDVVEAIVRVESSGNPRAYRYEEAFWFRYLADDPDYNTRDPKRVSASYGLMQVMFSTAVEDESIGVHEDPELLFVPTISLDAGCRHLAGLLKWSRGNLDSALAAYNGGKGGNAKPPYRNHVYLNKVKTALAAVRSERDTV